MAFVAPGLVHAGSCIAFRLY